MKLDIFFLEKFNYGTNKNIHKDKEVIDFYVKQSQLLRYFKENINKILLWKAIYKIQIRTRNKGTSLRDTLPVSFRRLSTMAISSVIKKIMTGCQESTVHIFV